jgi:hypothetical protein
MRSGSASIVLGALALALATASPGAAWGEAPNPKPSRPALPTSLRGALPAEKPAPAKPTVGRPVAAPLKPFFMPGPGAPAPIPMASMATDPDQCRVSCAHDYYFCLSAPESTDCSATWSQCRSICDRQPLQSLRRVDGRAATPLAD